jgi:hypothetical protein
LKNCRESIFPIAIMATFWYYSLYSIGLELGRTHGVDVHGHYFIVIQANVALSSVFFARGSRESHQVLLVWLSKCFLSTSYVVVEG